ncbi:Aspartic protease 3 [Aphelenchoides besseyi]|nr:Aspartic protease 3 [Aphelenchoides besseyi]
MWFHSLFVNCLLLAITNAEISWNFTTTESDLIPLIVQIGTPPVDVKLKSFIGTLFSFMTDMEVPTASIHGAYDPSHSTSFQQTDVLYDFDGSVIGLIGTETFMINSVKRTLLPFAARNDSLYAYYNGIGSLGFGRPTDNNVAQSFILSLISGEKEKVVSFAMDFVDSPSTSISHIINGTVSIGSRQPKHCSGSWLELPEVVFDYDYGQWGFKIEEISVGKYSYSVDSTATFLLTNVAFSIPEPFLTSIIQLMGGDVDKLTVSCDFSDDLIFTIGGQQFHLQPSDFMLQQAATSGGQCPFLGVQKEEFFSLPATLLRNRCLLYNYENPGVAITL